MEKILVTGGAGFIGSNFVRYWLKRHPNDKITILDLLTYAGNRDSIRDLEKGGRIRFVKGDIRSRKTVDAVMKGQDAVFHFAAETHVDRSILDSQVFLTTNILGTHTLLESARTFGLKKFVFISTDEVYGSIEKGLFTEKSPIAPNSPYASSKAGADLLARSYWTTYKLPVFITRCSNNYGPYQFPEKVIPLFITNLIEGKKVPIYGKGLNVREWIHVDDHSSAIETVYKKGAPGEVYNVGSGVELKNIELSKMILNVFGTDESMAEFVTDRPGHDLRYAINSSKLRKLGWKPKYTDFKKGLAETAGWYEENPGWWKKLKEAGQFKKYLKKQYRGSK